MYMFLLLSLTASVAIADDTLLMLFDRQTTPIPCFDLGQKNCGSGCIDTTWTCCPDLRGGCPPTEYCFLGTNDEYACCLNGKNCVGPGGATTSRGTIGLTSTFTPTSTSEFTSTSASTQKPASSSASTKNFVSTSGPSPTSASSSTTPSAFTSAKSSVVVLPTTSSNNSATASSFAAFTGGTGESYRAASPFHVLGAMFAALFVL